MTIEAIYENGVLRLLEPIDLAENTRVKIDLWNEQKKIRPLKSRASLREKQPIAKTSSIYIIENLRNEARY